MGNKNSVASFLSRISQNHNLSWIVVVLALIDISIANLAQADISISKNDVNFSELISTSPFLISFVIIVIAFILGEIFLLNYSRHKTKNLVNNEFLVRLNKIVTIIQLALTIIIVSILIEIILFSKYDTAFLIVSETVSMLSSIAILILLVYRFLDWYNVGKNLVSLIFGVSFLVLIINLSLSYYLDLVDFQNRIPSIYKGATVELGEPIIGDDLYEYFYFTLDFTFIVFFNLLWLGTVIIFKHRVATMGKTKYWTLMSLPLVYFLSYYIVAQYMDSLEESNLVILFNQLYLYGFIFGQCLVGIIFFLMSRGMEYQSKLAKDFIFIFLIGTFLSSIGVYGYIYLTLYPPFGVVSFSFLPLGHYLIFIGLYSATIVISGQRQIIHDLRKYAETQYFGDISNVELKTQLLNQVSSILTENAKLIEDQTGLELETSKDQIEHYMDLVLHEITKKKK
jgi:hypothetical protein